MGTEVRYGMQTNDTSRIVMNAAEEPGTPATPTAVAEPPAETKRSAKPAPPKVEEMPRYKVLLHNSDEPTMEDVIRAIVELTPHNVKRAVQIMMEAHTTGVSLVLVTHKERAELYEEQFRSVLLTVTIEPE